MDQLQARIERMMKTINPYDVARFMNILRSNIPDEIESKVVYEYIIRDINTHERCFPLITRETMTGLIDFIGRHSVLSVGAGSGWIESELEKRGIKITCTDDKSWHAPFAREYMAIDNVKAEEAVVKYHTDVLFMSWPPYATPMATQAIKGFTGQFLIYIGEWLCGCTADDEFFEFVGEHFEELAIEIPIKNYTGLHDSVHVFKRKDM
jgi:hypothetical protein